MQFARWNCHTNLRGESMKINDLVKIGERTEQRVIHHNALWDDNGNIVANAWDETVEVQVPVMGTVYRDASPDEMDEMERQQAEMPEPEPSPEDRLDALETATDDIILMMADLIGGN